MELRRYESMVAFADGWNEAKVKEELAKVKDVFATHGATSMTVQVLGRKELPGMGDKITEGSYVLFIFDTVNPETVSKVEGLLRINEAVLKFKTSRIGIPKKKFKINPKLAGKASFDELLEGDAVL